MNSILAPDNAPPASATRTSPLMSALARAVLTAPLPGSDRGRGVDARLDYASAERFGNTHPLMPAVALVAPWLARIARMPPKIACTAAFAPRATTFGGSHAHAVSPPRLGVRTARPPPAGRSKPARGASAIRLRVQRRSSRLTMTLINVIVIARAPQTAIVAHRGIGPRAIGRLTARRRAARPSTLETRPSYETATHRNR
ncbi:hypothetical protein [Burkholderia pseudomallei]|uniref:hypothetical protein n=1 Tax=Burkholderia pseudomallei TaxID=28450 RepID=UPI00211662F7|nr:hypothetical protein [Burkholderia pseudomallei]